MATSKESGQNAEHYAVVCAWCAAVIRRTAARPSRGMCKNCFARLLNRHIRPHQTAQNTLSISER